VPTRGVPSTRSSSASPVNTPIRQGAQINLGRQVARIRLGKNLTSILISKLKLWLSKKAVMSVALPKPPYPKAPITEAANPNYS
jgi:hypothetical protein